MRVMRRLRSEYGLAAPSVRAAVLPQHWDDTAVIPPIQDQACAVSGSSAMANRR